MPVLLKARLLVLLVPVLIIACTSDSHQDLKKFIAESKQEPPGTIRQLPKYDPYVPYVYDAFRLRSPFEPAVEVKKRLIATRSTVKPDFKRQKQRLESFDMSSLSMVGTVEKRGVLWALIKDSNNSIERVKVGAYLGKNHGRITGLTEEKIDIIEIVPDGVGAWIERPNIISIREKE